MSLPEKSDYNSLGGEIINYSDVEDPNTDLDAEFSNETRLNVAAMTQTCVIAIASFTVNAGVVSVGNTDEDYNSVYGRASSYKPSVVRNSTGTYTITLPDTIVDARGITRSNNIKFGHVNSSSAGYFGSFERLSANTCRVYLSNTSGLADPPNSLSRITVFVY